MFSLSKESENSLKRGILKLVENFLKDYLKPKQRITGLMTPKQLKEELEIDYNTLKRWVQGSKGSLLLSRIHAKSFIESMIF